MCAWVATWRHCVPAGPISRIPEGSPAGLCMGKDREHRDAHEIVSLLNQTLAKSSGIWQAHISRVVTSILSRSALTIAKVAPLTLIFHMASALHALRWGHRSHKKCTCTSQRSVACRVRNVDYPEALLFDCDGVLVDTELDGHRVAFNKAFKEKGLQHEWDADVYGKLLEIGGGKERMNAYFSEHADTEPFLSITNPEEQAKFLKEIHLLKTGIFQEMIEAGQMPLRPGVKELVADAMDAGVQIAVCSTSNEKAVQTIVDVLLSEASSAMPVFAGDIVPAKKPDPAIYKLAAEKLGVDPTRCVVVEDSFIGLQAARAAGMRCVVTKSSYTQNEDFSIADAVFDCIGDNFRIDDLTTPGTFWLNPPLPMDVNGNWVDPPKSPYGESWVGIDVDLER